jgi:hypothetical protein
MEKKMRGNKELGINNQQPRRRKSLLKRGRSDE